MIYGRRRRELKSRKSRNLDLEHLKVQNLKNQRGRFNFDFEQVFQLRLEILEPIDEHVEDLFSIVLQHYKWIMKRTSRRTSRRIYKPYESYIMTRTV